MTTDQNQTKKIHIYGGIDEAQMIARVSITQSSKARKSSLYAVDDDRPLES